MLLNVEYKISSVYADINWNLVLKDGEILTDKKLLSYYRVKIVGGSSGETKMDRYSHQETCTTIHLEPGWYYTVTVEAVRRGRVQAESFVRFKAIFNVLEIIALQNRANNFIRNEIFGTDMQEINIFYRSKPPEYWQEIQNSDGVMKPYIKDPTGHPGSPINGEIFGLFFSGRLIRGNLPIASPYGSQRFRIPCQKLFLPQRHNMYFCDFYCNNTRHYVTIVVCEIDTAVDKYCANKLLQLDPFNNLFLQLVETDSYDYRYFLNNNIWIELFYTADVRLWWGEFDYVFPLGVSDPGGIPNNKICKTCNLYV